MSFEKMSILEAYLVNLSGRKSGIPENVIISLERVILGKRMTYSCSVAQFTLEKSNKTPFTEPTLKFVTQCYLNVSPLIIVGKTYRTGIGVPKKTTQSRNSIYYGVY